MSDSEKSNFMWVVIGFVILSVCGLMHIYRFGILTDRVTELESVVSEEEQ